MSWGWLETRDLDCNETDENISKLQIMETTNALKNCGKQCDTPSTL